MSVEVKGYIFVLTEKKCRTVISLISSQRCSFYIRKGNSNLFRLLKDTKRYFFLSENKTVQAVYQILKKNRRRKGRDACFTYKTKVKYGGKTKT